MSSHFATPRKPQPPTFWVEPATQKPADNPEGLLGARGKGGVINETGHLKCKDHSIQWSAKLLSLS